MRSCVVGVNWCVWALVMGVFLASGSQGRADEVPTELLSALLEGHNRERAAASLPPLTLNAKLNAAAQGHARDMADHDKMTHDGSDGSTPAQRIERQHYNFRASGENVAEGQTSVAEVMKGWMNSPPHKKNILGDFKEMGAGRAASSDGTLYWSVDFGLPWIALDPAQASSDVVAALNRARADAKKPPLSVAAALQSAALRHARAMAAAGKFVAKDDDGLTPFERVEKSGFRFKRLDESVASGRPTPEAVAQNWLESPSSRDHLLGASASIGVGYAAASNGVPYWCLLIAEPR